MTAAAAVIPAGMLVLLPIEGLLNVVDHERHVRLHSAPSRLAPCSTAARPTCGSCSAWEQSRSRSSSPVCRGAWRSSPSRWGSAAFLALSSYSVLGSVRTQSLAALASQGVAPNDLSWVDDRVGTDAHVVFVNNISLAENPHTLWQTEFWNRSIESVVDLAVPPHIMLGRVGAIDRQTGGSLPATRLWQRRCGRLPYAVAPTSLELAGTGDRQAREPPRPLPRRSSAASGAECDRPVQRRLDGRRHGHFPSTRRRGSGAAVSSCASLRPTLVRRRPRRPCAGDARGRAPAGRRRRRDRDRRPRREALDPLAENRPVVVSLPTPKPPFLFQLHVTPTFSPVDDRARRHPTAGRPALVQVRPAPPDERGAPAARPGQPASRPRSRPRPPTSAA